MHQPLDCGTDVDNPWVTAQMPSAKPMQQSISPSIHARSDCQAANLIENDDGHDVFRNFAPETIAPSLIAPADHGSILGPNAMEDTASSASALDIRNFNFMDTVQPTSPSIGGIDRWEFMFPFRCVTPDFDILFNPGIPCRPPSTRLFADTDGESTIFPFPMEIPPNIVSSLDPIAQEISDFLTNNPVDNHCGKGLGPLESPVPAAPLRTHPMRTASDEHRAPEPVPASPRTLHSFPDGPPAKRFNS